jgi:hypothetical protein
MRWVVVCERCDIGVRNDDAAQCDSVQLWERQRHNGAQGDRALRRARRHGTVGTAGVTVVPVSQGLAAAGMG